LFDFGKILEDLLFPVGNDRWFCPLCGQNLIPKIFMNPTPVKRLMFLLIA
jgi:hypothetical protein